MVQIYWSNLTLAEAFRPPMFRGVGPDKDGFNLGKANNFYEVFGERKATWFLPISTRSGRDHSLISVFFIAQTSTRLALLCVDSVAPSSFFLSVHAFPGTTRRFFCVATTVLMVMYFFVYLFTQRSACVTYGPCLSGLSFQFGRRDVVRLPAPARPRRRTRPSRSLLLLPLVRSRHLLQFHGPSRPCPCHPNQDQHHHFHHHHHQRNLPTTTIHHRLPLSVGRASFARQVRLLLYQR